MKRLFKNSVIVILLLWTTIYFPSCKKEATLPVVTTISVSNITQTTAITGGNVTDNGGAEITDLGVCWSTSPNPTISSNKAPNGIITGLTANTTYYLRAYATNSVGTSYGNEVTFKTNDVIKATTIPTLTTTPVTAITSTSAVSGGTITDDGGEFISNRGVCWGTGHLPTIYNTSLMDLTGLGSFTINLSSLDPGTTYYVRAYAINSVGIAYGNPVSFTTLPLSLIINFNPNLSYDTVSDINGNIYKTIQIGTQLWMAENLKTANYNDNTPIPNITDDLNWMDAGTGAYCWYHNQETTYKNTYGALYNWYAVNTGKLCPTGWHVPSKEEWMILATYLGNVELAGSKLKESGTTHWQNPNKEANNSSGFTALPGGVRDVSSDFGGFFSSIGTYGFWWSSTPGNEPTDHSLWLDSNSDKFSFIPVWIRDNSGLSVRCLKD